VVSEAIPSAVRRFQSEIDAIRHEVEPLSVRATVLVFGAACLVLAVLLTIARVDRVVSSTGGKIVSVDAPLVLQALDPSIVKSIDVREGEVVEKDRLLATLDPTFAVADVRQPQEQIDSLNAQITREDAELTHRALDSFPTSDPAGSDTRLFRGRCSTSAPRNIQRTSRASIRRSP
jgi:hemolysin D